VCKHKAGRPAGRGGRGGGGGWHPDVGGGLAQLHVGEAVELGAGHAHPDLRHLGLRLPLPLRRLVALLALPREPAPPRGLLGRAERSAEPRGRWSRAERHVRLRRPAARAQVVAAGATGASGASHGPTPEAPFSPP
jgi:hypothetical protein